MLQSLDRHVSADDCVRIRKVILRNPLNEKHSWRNSLEVLRTLARAFIPNVLFPKCS